MASCETSRWQWTAPYVRLTVTEKSSDGGSVTLNWILEYYSDSAGHTSYEKEYYVNIDGDRVATGAYDIAYKTGWNTITSGTKTVSKSTSERTVKFDISFSFNMTWGGVECTTKTASGSITIAAKSSYTISYNANGGSGAPSSQTKWHGTAITLSSTKPTRTGYAFQGWATSSTGGVTYAAGASYTANAKVTLYAVWKANTYTVVYNANGGSGAPANQTKTHGVTLTLSSAKPTRTNYTFKGWGTSASSTTVAYAAGASYTANAGITLYAIWTLAYTKPRITNISVKRCTSNGTVSDEGTNALVSFNWACDKSVSSIVIEAVSATTSTITSTVSASGTSGTVTNKIVGNDNLSTEVTYTIRIVVTDSVDYTRKSETLESEKFSIDLKAGGNGVAFGKAAELDGYVDFGLDAHFNNYLGIYGRDLDGNIKLALQPQNENGNTVIGWGNYNMKTGNTNLYGHDVLIGVSNIASPETYRPYIRRGDSFNVTIRTAGYVTSSGTAVSFIVPLTRPVIGSPTVTATSVNGFTLRQGSLYTHGSTSSAETMPTSYSASSYYTMGILITATFSDTTNVTNNDSIGIYWSGNLTFT